MTNRTNTTKLRVVYAIAITHLIAGAPATAAGQWEIETVKGRNGYTKIASNEISDTVRYELHSVCRGNLAKPELEFQVKVAKDSPDLNKHLPYKAIPKEGRKTTDEQLINLSFDWASVGNPWVMQGRQEDENYILAISLRKHEFYAQKIRQFLKSSKYLNLEIKSIHTATPLFKSAIPIYGIKEHIPEMIRCKAPAGRSIQTTSRN